MWIRFGALSCFTGNVTRTRWAKRRSPISSATWPVNGTSRLRPKTRPSARLPVVLTKEEVRAVLKQMSGELRLMAELLYGSGLRLMECVRLRVKDVDFGYGQIMVRDAEA